MDLDRLPLPDHLVEQNRAFTSGEATPVEPRNAATVVLMRPGSSQSEEPEVYLLRRQTSMAFAGGMYVFPGGKVDPADDDPAVAWAGPPPQEWARRLDVEEDLARALVCAAVRETFEECGVLLAGPDASSLVADTTGEDWEEDRRALEAGELHFADFLVRRGLVLRTDLLGAWAGWLTPIFEPRRYRTWFFVASLPEGQATRDVSTESSEVHWMPALDAVREAITGNVLMLPPTLLTCLDVGQHPDPDAVLEAAADRKVSMFMPEVEEAGDGSFRLSTPPEHVDLIRSWRP